ncbi:MAG: type II toxin-antitoxin system RelE family toxin [Candidatus Woesearchaeota archaeon]
MKVIFSDESNKFLHKIPKSDVEVILKKLYTIKDNPYPYIKRLKGSKLWRIRVLKYRAILDIVIKAKTLYVVRIGYRKNVYD